MAKAIPGLMILLLGSGLSACNALAPGSIAGGKSALFVNDEERDCLGRAMYFEAKRSDEDGLLAVGTVVMNRTEVGGASRAICDVVGQRGQFASGVLTKPMREKDLQKVADVADALLAGERHPKVGKAMFFHTADRRFSYPNMHYVAVIGGNAFYEKRKREGSWSEAKRPVTPPSNVLAFAETPDQPTP